MMRNVAIGLTAATIAISGSTLGASAARLAPDRFVVISRLTPHEREHLTRIERESSAELTPREREHLREGIRERLAELTPLEREHLRGAIRQRLAELPPLERKRLKGMMMHESHEQLSRLERERPHRHGPYGLR